MNTNMIGKKYIGAETGVIVTVTGIICAKDNNGNLRDFVTYSFDLNTNTLPLHKFKEYYLEIVQTDNGDNLTNELPVDKLRELLPEAKWIAQDIDGEIYLYQSVPTARPGRGIWLWKDGKMKFVPSLDFPEVYEYFSDIPWNESLTAI